MVKDSLARGKWGEDAAVEFLENQGYRILERNYRIPGGEIDIIAEDDDELVFVEVKSYAAGSLTPLDEAIPDWKKGLLLRAARRYLSGKEEQNARFDILTIERKGATARIEHYKDAFTA